MHNPTRKLLLLLSAVLTLSACAATPGLTPAQQTQADFTAACKYANGAWQVAQPILATPLVQAKLGATGVLAAKSFGVALTTTCGTPLDITNASAVIQNVYDIAGQVVALVITAQSAP